MLVSGLLLSTTSSGFEKRERIDRHACDAHLEMQVRSGTVAGRSHEGDRLSRGNDVARLHERPVEMAVERAQLRISRKEDVEAVTTALALDRDGADGGSVDRRAQRSGQVDSAVEVMAGALRRPGLDLERGAAEALRDRRLPDRRQQNAAPSLPGLDDQPGDQQRKHQAGGAGGEEWPAPGPGEGGEARRGQHGHALEVRAVVVAMALLTARLANPSPRCCAFNSKCEDAFISPGTLMSR